MYGGARPAIGLVALLIAVYAGLAGCRAAEPEPVEANVPACSHELACDGVWVDFPDPRFVPQGLALGPHGTAYLSGYLWRPEEGHRQCQVLRVDRRTGKVRAHATLSECRHGGGLTLTTHGLWVAGAHRLWLLDPVEIGHGDPVRRSWRVEKPIRASTITSTPDGLVLAKFVADRPGRTYRFDYDDVLEAGATTLVDQGSTPGLVSPVSVTRAPAWLQGISFGPGGLWYATSSTYCGALTRPSGARQSTVPGAEGIDFDSRHDLWVVSESGSAPYQRDGGRPRVPTLTRVDADALDDAGPPDCAWD